MSEELALEVSVVEVNQRRSEQPSDQENWLFLDCREQDEYATASIENTTLIPMNAVPSRVSEIEAYREKPIIVFCHGGVRSMRVTQWLRQEGFVLAQSMAGGIDSWSREIDPEVPTY